MINKPTILTDPPTGEGAFALSVVSLNPVLYERTSKLAIKGISVAGDRRTLQGPSALSVVVGSSLVKVASAALDLNVAASWDTQTPTDYTVAANRAGKDFYVYAVATGLILSANSTVPSGYAAGTSRKVGGFHCLCVAAGTIASHSLSGFLAGDLLPESIWDLKFRPSCSPEGMVYDALSNLWVDIYLQSGTGVSTASVNGGTITDSRTWNDFVDDLSKVGKRLMFDSEFQVATQGANQKTNITGSADPVTTGGHTDTAARRMLSNIGLEDACGVMWQWLMDQSFRLDQDGTVQAAALTFVVTHTATPGGNPIYLRIAADGSYYLASNMATATADKHIGPTNHKVPIKHDANAATGAVGQVYYNSGGTAPAKMLCNVATISKDVFLATNNPGFSLQIKHDASAATNGRALYYDDGADNRLECNLASAANDNADLANNSPSFNYYDVGGNQGSLYRQGGTGDVKLLAGGAWPHGTYCGSRSRNASNFRWAATSSFGARGCARSQNS